MRSLGLSCFIWAALTASAQASAYVCPAPNFTKPRNVALSGKAVLIVTHVSTIWDYRQSAKRGLDRLVESAKMQKVPIVYLQGADSAQTYFYDDCKPDYFVNSSGGEFSFSFEATHVITVGGHFEYCQHTSIQQIFGIWQLKHPHDDLKLTEVADAIYAFGSPYVNTAASYYQKYEWYRGVYDSEKISLADLFRIMADEKDQLEFINKYLNTLNPPKTHKVVIQINGAQKVVYRHGPTLRAPTLTINFVTGHPNSEAVFGKK